MEACGCQIIKYLGCFCQIMILEGGKCKLPIYEIFSPDSVLMVQRILAKSEMEHPRLILRNFLSPEICKELEFIHKSCCTVGYRPNVFSTTLSHLIAANSAHLIMPLVPIRERLKEKVEEHFGCEYELFVEFTGLISWCRGASIGWHSDDNRDYLKQRDFAAVCYLNSYEVDFSGGLFHFQDGEPLTIAPMAGVSVLFQILGLYFLLILKSLSG